MITIVSDSSIALTKAEAAALGVNIVPINYVVDGTAYLEYGADTLDAFDKIEKGTFEYSTSQPSVEAFRGMFKQLVDLGQSVICLTISSRLSGTYSSAVLAANEVDAQKIKVVDTLAIAGGIRFLAERAKELINEGQQLDTIFYILQSERDRAGIAFSVENMEPIKRSGRLGFIRQSVSAILNIKPILQCVNGSIECVGFIRGKRNQNEKLLDCIPKTAQKVIVHHLGNELSAKDLAKAVEEKFAHLDKPRITTVGPALALHIGVPAIGVAWIM